MPERRDRRAAPWLRHATQRDPRTVDAYRIFLDGFDTGVRPAVPAGRADSAAERGPMRRPGSARRIGPGDGQRDSHVVVGPASRRRVRGAYERAATRREAGSSLGTGGEIEQGPGHRALLVGG